MDDRHLEERLRKCWSPNPPEGMKERIFHRTRQELGRRPSRASLFVCQWRLALAGVGILAFLLSSVSEQARDERLAAMIGEPGIEMHNIAEWQRQRDMFMASTLAELESNGEGSL